VYDQVQMASGFMSNWSCDDLCAEPSVMTGELRSINDLPDDILLKILSHFGPEDLRFIIAEVCE
jgi:hypothetical protein